MLPNFSGWPCRKRLFPFCNWVTPFARFDLEVCKWLYSQKPFPAKVSHIHVKHFTFSDVCKNVILLGVKTCTLSHYNLSRCLTLTDFNTEYDLPGEVVDMQINELHQYFDKSWWLFIENKVSGSKTEYWFWSKSGIHKIKKFNIITFSYVFLWRH